MCSIPSNDENSTNDIIIVSTPLPVRHIGPVDTPLNEYLVHMGCNNSMKQNDYDEESIGSLPDLELGTLSDKQSPPTDEEDDDENFLKKAKFDFTRRRRYQDEKQIQPEIIKFPQTDTVAQFGSPNVKKINNTVTTPQDQIGFVESPAGILRIHHNHHNTNDNRNLSFQIGSPQTQKTKSQLHSKNEQEANDTFESFKNDCNTIQLNLSEQQYNKLGIDSNPSTPSFHKVSGIFLEEKEEGDENDLEEIKNNLTPKIHVTTPISDKADTSSSSLDLSVAYSNGTWAFSPPKTDFFSHSPPVSLFSPNKYTTTNLSKVTWHCYEDEKMPLSSVKLSLFNESEKNLCFHLKLCGNGHFEVHPKVLNIEPHRYGEIFVTLTQLFPKDEIEGMLTFEMRGENNSKNENMKILLRGIIAKKPIIQVNTCNVVWNHGGNSRLIRLRNAGQDSILIKTSIVTDEGDESRFSIVGLREERCRPYENISIWVRCSRGQNFASGKLVLHVTPWINNAGDHNERVSAFQQQMYEISLLAGQK